MNKDGLPSASPNGCGQASEIPSNEEWYPSPRRTGSPLPISEHDVAHRARSNYSRTSLHDGTDHTATSGAGIQGLSPYPSSSFVSDEDLKHLLTLVLAPSRYRLEKGKRHRGARRDVLLRVGKHLFGPHALYDDPSSALSHTQHAKRVRLKTAKLRMRGTSQGTSETVSVANVNEGLVVIELARENDCDAAEWQDE